MLRRKATVHKKFEVHLREGSIFLEFSGFFGFFFEEREGGEGEGRLDIERCE